MYRNLDSKIPTSEAFTHFLCDIAVSDGDRIAFRGNDDVESFGEEIPMQPEKLPDEPLDPVPLNRVPNFFADRNPQPRKAQPVFLENQNKMSCMTASARAI